MNAEHGLDGQQVRALVEALINAYTPDQLDELLYFELTKSLDHITTGSSFRAHVFNLVRASIREGWLPELIIAATKGNPGNARLSDWIAANGHVVGSAATLQPAAYMLLRYESMNFDLLELRRIMLRAIKQPANPIVGLAIRYPDDILIAKLCDWLELNLSNTKRKDALNLYSDVGTADREIRKVARYRRDLDSADVLCKVYTQGVATAVITEFWHGLQREFAGIRRRLVLVFACDPSTELPEGMHELPPPQFEVTDVDFWTRDIVRLYEWPVELADKWSAWLCEESMDNDVLDIRGLYETMDEHIQEVRHNPHVFRRRLEGRAGYANAPQT
jgi:hypothetical protein